MAICNSADFCGCRTYRRLSNQNLYLQKLSYSQFKISQTNLSVVFDIFAQNVPNYFDIFNSELQLRSIAYRTKPYPFSHIIIGWGFYFTELHERSEMVIIDADR